MLTLTISSTAAKSGATQVPNAVILDHFRDAPEDYVKIYIFALMQAQSPALLNEDISCALGTDDGKIAAAFEYWARRGLVRVLPGENMHVEFLPVQVQPSYANQDAHGKYDELLTALRDVMGMRVFSSTELRVVYDWVEVFGLPYDVVVRLVAYCMELKGRSVSVKYMDSVAKSWADMRLYTLAELDEYLDEQNEYAGRVREIKKRWRLSRNITEDELNLYKKWSTEWNLPHDVIMTACADAVHASSPSFAYLDSVLEAYRERGTVDRETMDAYNKKRMLSDELARKMFEKAGLKRKPTLTQRDRVDIWLNDWRIPEDALLLLSERAAAFSKPFEFMVRVVSSWNERDIRNAEDARKDLNSPREKSPQDKRYSPKQTRGRKYSADDLKRLGINIGEDGKNEKNGKDEKNDKND